jgi:hypothetical protein
MRLPNAEKAVVEIAKLQDYCLSTVHPEGRHKARVFYSVLGLGSWGAKELRVALLAAARENEAIEVRNGNPRQ